MPSIDSAELIASVRDDFGPSFVPARVAAEDDARRFIEDHLGRMDAARIAELGRLFNRHEKSGRARSPD